MSATKQAFVLVRLVSLNKLAFGKKLKRFAMIQQELVAEQIVVKRPKL